MNKVFSIVFKSLLVLCLIFCTYTNSVYAVPQQAPQETYQSKPERAIPYGDAEGNPLAHDGIEGDEKEESVAQSDLDPLDSFCFPCPCGYTACYIDIDGQTLLRCELLPDGADCPDY